jgi:hypothetical protein
MSDAPSPEPTAADVGPLDHDAFVDATDLADLAARYQAAGVTLDGDALIRRALADWHRVSLARAREVTEPPPELDAVTAEADGVTYAIYGVMHGMVGGNEKDYKEFVDRRLSALPQVLFENGLHLYYPPSTYVVIPDYLVLGPLGSLRLGLEVGLFFPVLMFELLGDLFRRGGGSGEIYDYTPAYHAVDPETRRGVDPAEPVLPSRLQIDLELSAWARRGWRAPMADPMAIVPRSAFMAGFAQGHAKSRGLDHVDLVLGDLHTVEVQRFLEEPGRWPAAEPFLAAGRAFGERSPLRYRLGIVRAKGLHLLFAAGAGCAVIVPVILFLYALGDWLFRAPPPG